MNSIVVSSDNVALIDAVKDILLTACCEPAFCVNEKDSQHKHYLNEIGFPALGENNFGSNDIKPELVSELLHVICE
jgi:neurofibromin 1